MADTREGGILHRRLHLLSVISITTSPANTFAGTQKITEDIVLSKDADEFTTTGTSEVFDTNGNLVSTGCNTLTGTRID